MCSGAFWNWWVGAAARFNVVAQGPSETPWPEVGTLGWPGRLRSWPLAGVVVGCGLAWVFRGVGMFHQGPVSELLWSRGLWAAWTRAGPSSQQGLLLLAQHLCGEASLPLSLLSSTLCGCPWRTHPYIPLESQPPPVCPLLWSKDAPTLFLATGLSGAPLDRWPSVSGWQPQVPLWEP